jgi:hypothetical protein
MFIQISRQTMLLLINNLHKSIRDKQINLTKCGNLSAPLNAAMFVLKKEYFKIYPTKT